MSQQHKDIVRVLRDLGPLSHHGIIHAMQAVQTYTSPSGIRTRVKELEDAGVVEPSGEFEFTPAGRKAVLWKLVS